MRVTFAFISCVIGTCAGAVSAQSLLYDVTFSQPEFVPGQVVPVGSTGMPRTRPTEILNTPTVSNSFSGLPGNVGLLSPPTNSTAENIIFAVPEQFPAYRVSFDLAISTPGTILGGAFTLFADVPTVRPFSWLSNGTITGLVASGGSRVPIGRWNLNQAYAIEAIWDLEQQSATLFIDGQHIVTQPFSATEVRTFRLSTGNNPAFPAPPTVAGVDNIRIEGLVPAPSSGAFVVIGWMALARRRRASL